MMKVTALFALPVHRRRDEMGEDYTLWIDHPDVPAAYRSQIRELVDDLQAALAREVADSAGLRQQLAACCKDAREYVDAVATWEGEGGR